MLKKKDSSQAFEEPFSLPAVPQLRPTRPRLFNDAAPPAGPPPNIVRHPSGDQVSSPPAPETPLSPRSQRPPARAPPPIPPKPAIPPRPDTLEPPPIRPRAFSDGGVPLVPASSNKGSSSLPFTKGDTNLKALIGADQQRRQRSFSAGGGEARGENLVSVNRPNVPIVVSKLIDHIFTHGLRTEGIFRVPGNLTTMPVLESQFNSGNYVLSRDLTCEDSASLLKKFLRESLAEPLFTEALTPSFAALKPTPESDKQDTDGSDWNSRFLALFRQLPIENQELTLAWLELLVQIDANSEHTKMTAENLSTVFGAMGGIPIPEGGWLVKRLIERYHLLFVAPKITHISGTSGEEASTPLFLKKFAYHKKSIAKVYSIDNGKYVFAADVSGLLTVWDAHQYRLLKKVSLAGSNDLRFFQPPLFVQTSKKDQGEIWWFFVDGIRIWRVAEVLDAEGATIEDKKENIIPVSNITDAVCAGDSVWVATIDTLQVIEVRTRKIVRTFSEKGDVTQALGFVYDLVWTVNSERMLTSWNPKTFKRSDPVLIEELRQPRAFHRIGDKLWITMARGPVVVVDMGRMVVTSVLQEQVFVYDVAVVGNVAWTIAWDPVICLWDTKSLSMFRSLPTRHHDAITTIAVIRRPDRKGWDVWTGSSDRSIQVMFVSDGYASNSDTIIKTVGAIEDAIRSKEEQIKQLELDMRKLGDDIKASALKLIAGGKDHGSEQHTLLSKVKALLESEQEKENQLLARLDACRTELLKLRQQQRLNQLELQIRSGNS